MKKSALYFFLLIAVPVSALPQDQIVKIWPNLAPGSETAENREQWTDGKSVTNVYQPDLTVYVPEHHQAEPSAAVLVFPGGGYRQVVMEKEGYKVARWLNEHGISAFVLKYRLNPDDALRDAQRAISLIRNDASKYNIDKNRIGVIGFSAGAHLAFNLALNPDDHESHDAIDAVSSRPDFLIGVYGAYSGLYSGDGKTGGLDDIPPVFLVHAGNDSRAPVRESVDLYIELKRHAVPAELHVYEQGEHGFALETDRGKAVTSTVIDWSERLLEWLKVRGIKS